MPPGFDEPTVNPLWIKNTHGSPCAEVPTHKVGLRRRRHGPLPPFVWRAGRSTRRFHSAPCSPRRQRASRDVSRRGLGPTKFRNSVVRRDPVNTRRFFNVLSSVLARPATKESQRNDSVELLCVSCLVLSAGFDLQGPLGLPCACCFSPRVSPRGPHKKHAIGIHLRGLCRIH